MKRKRQPADAGSGSSPDKSLERLQAKRESAQRKLWTGLKFWEVCPERQCLRARSCRGDVNACRDRFWPQVPKDIKVWLQAAIKARRDGMSPEDANRVGQARAEQVRALEARFEAERRAAADAEAMSAAATRKAIDGALAPPTPSVPPRVRVM